MTNQNSNQIAQLFLVAAAVLTLVWICPDAAYSQAPTPDPDEANVNKPAIGSSPGSIPLEKMVKNAEWIVVGDVTDLQARREEGPYHVYTYVTVKITTTLAGGPLPEITLKLPGGTAEEVTEDVPAVPHFTKGEHVLLFAESVPQSPGALKLLGAHQGKFSLVTKDSKWWAVNDLGEDLAEKLRSCQGPLDQCPALSGVLVHPYPDVIDEIRKIQARR